MKEEEIEKLIAIPLEEYKELLVIKGKYEEYSKSRLQYDLKTGDPIPGTPYKITC